MPRAGSFAMVCCVSGTMPMPSYGDALNGSMLVTSSGSCGSYTRAI